MACKWSLPLTSCLNPHVQAACPLALQPLQLAHLHAQFTRVPAQALRALGCQWVSSKPKGSSIGVVHKLRYTIEGERGEGVRAGVTLRFLGGGGGRSQRNDTLSIRILPPSAMQLMPRTLSTLSKIIRLHSVLFLEINTRILLT